MAFMGVDREEDRQLGPLIRNLSTRIQCHSYLFCHCLQHIQHGAISRLGGV